jgi:hypothetical protein
MHTCLILLLVVMCSYSYVLFSTENEGHPIHRFFPPKFNLVVLSLSLPLSHIRLFSVLVLQNDSLHRRREESYPSNWRL